MKKLLLLLTLIPVLGFTQTDSVKVVQLTGVTVSTDSLQPVPYANIIIKGNYSGTMSDYSGFYSIVARTGDTLVFSSIGYANSEYIIPDSLSNKQYSLIQMLDRDTVKLEVTEIKVWPSYPQFKQAFLSNDIPEDELKRAERNLDKDVLKEQAINLHMGSGGNQKLMTERYRSRLYYSGQLPPNNLLNPIAWAKLIKAWQDGKFDDEK